MTAYNVTLTCVVDGDERHAEKLADKLENVVLSSKHVVSGADGALVSTDIEAQP